MLNQTNNNSDLTNNPIPTVKKELPKRNNLPMYLGLFIVVLVALAGIGISLRQFFVRDIVAPTAPTESQASIDKIQECSVSFDVAPPESGISCTKQAYRDELSNTPGEYELVQVQNTFNPGDVIVYSFIVSNTGEQTATITATDTLQINNDDTFNYEFLDSNCDEDAFENNTVTCVAEGLEPGEDKIFSFRIRLSDQIDSDATITNAVAITDGSLTNECSVDVTITTDEYEAYCNEECSENADCVEANNACINNVCRLISNPESELCEEPTVSPSPTPVVSPSPTPETVSYCGEYCATNSDCVMDEHICYFNQCRLADYPDRTDCSVPQATTPITYVEPTPTVGCNEDCLSNRDCSNNDHICYEGSCRLADYPASTSCTVPQQAQSQPKMPDELPQSGSDDLINWIKAGIGILGAGALLLLL